MSFLVPLMGFAALAARSVLADASDGECDSYGMDFQGDGTYFQNSNSNDNFTFVSEFEGCQSGAFAYNILVDPSGIQYPCSNTNLTPDDADMLSTCNREKSQLFDGLWSLLIFSNNGGADGGLAAERDFSLTVGPQSTTTFTPTVTATAVSVPLVNITLTVTDSFTTTLPPSTVTSPSTTVTPKVTVTPARVTTTTTKALLTITFTSYSMDVIKSTVTKTASCRVPRRQPTADPTCTIKPTVGPAATLISSKFRREAAEIEENNRRWLLEREARVKARAPDAQPLIVTETNTNLWPTVTSTSVAAATTATLTTSTSTTITQTPPPITVLSGQATAAVVTTTAPTPTRTITKLTIATAISTKVKSVTFTLTTTTYPAASSTSCRRLGGYLY